MKDTYLNLVNGPLKQVAKSLGLGWEPRAP